MDPQTEVARLTEANRQLEAARAARDAQCAQKTSDMIGKLQASTREQFRRLRADMVREQARVTSLLRQKDQEIESIREENRRAKREYDEMVACLRANEKKSPDRTYQFDRCQRKVLELAPQSPPPSPEDPTRYEKELGRGRERDTWWCGAENQPCRRHGSPGTCSGTGLASSHCRH